MATAPENGMSMPDQKGIVCYIKEKISRRFLREPE